MLALIEFLKKYHHYLLLVVLEGLSFALLFQFNHYHSSVWLTTANVVVGKVNAWQQEALSYIRLGKVNEDLMRRNLILEHNNEELTRRILELSHDSTWAERQHAKRMSGYQMLPARIITNSVLRRNNFITIDRGEADGIKAEMGVVCGTGIVGIVYQTSRHYAIVLPLLNSHSSISCRLRGSSYFGYLRWEGGSPLYASLDDIPRHARFKVGDVVETSGFSSVFPPGIFVGKIDAITNSDDGLSYKLRIHLGVDFANLQNVSVVLRSHHAELQQLEQKADSVSNL